MRDRVSRHLEHKLPQLWSKVLKIYINTLNRQYFTFVVYIDHQRLPKPSVWCLSWKRTILYVRKRMSKSILWLRTQVAAPTPLLSWVHSTNRKSTAKEWKIRGLCLLSSWPVWKSQGWVSLSQDACELEAYAYRALRER